MAALHASDSGATSPSNSSDSDTESSTTNYGHVDDEPYHLSYRKGELTWGSYKLKDEDIITVTGIKGSNVGHTILSLVPTDAESQKPFELRTTNATLLPEAFLDEFQFRGLPPHLDPSINLQILISTLSGTGLSPAFYDDILHPLLKNIGLADSNYNVVRTKSAESVMEFARSTLLVGANEGKNQTVLMLSGDGGMVDTINGLLESGNKSSTYIPPVLSQLPLGTGNALFHSLHKPSKIPSIYIQGLRTLLHGSPKPLPIFQAKFSPGARSVTNEGQNATPLSNDTVYGAVVASYGLHATLVADSDTTEYRKHGDKRFGLVAKDLLFPEDGTMPHAYQAQVTLTKSGKQDALDRKEHGYILASLVSNLEKTFTISPASKPLDGQLRVVNFGALDGQQTMEIMKAAYADGKHPEIEGVGYDAVDSLRIDFLEKGESWKWRRCCIDGLIVGVEEGGWIEVKMVAKGAEAVHVVSDA
ncbi:ATP-NAD kinase-like domain-containing protein [Halenospora varia]|nr:ATP-NAD kinase-like domain-containing protein [Halenospora varia]